MDQTQDISQEELERIERYLLNQMATEEREAFETQLSNNPSLREKVAEMQLLMVGVKETILRDRLHVYHQDRPLAESEYRIGGERSTQWKTWLVAASVFLLAGVGGWLILSGGSTHERLFAAHFKPDPGLITAMSATDNYAFEQAMLDYKRKEYGAAIQAWDSLQKLQPANDTLNYFLGVAHLANEDSQAAISYLQKATASAFFKDDAFWYLGLALLKEGRKEEAINAISQSNHAQKDELLKKLK